MKLKKIIETHGLILLNMYGVKEKLINKNPEKLKVFAELLAEEINKNKLFAKKTLRKLRK